MSIKDRLANRARKREERRARLDEKAHAVRQGADALMRTPVRGHDGPVPGTFCHLYSSRDDILSVFEDGSGHLVAVESARLA